MCDLLRDLLYSTEMVLTRGRNKPTKHSIIFKSAFVQNTGLRQLYLRVLRQMGHTTVSEERKEQITSSVVRNFVINAEIQGGLPQTEAEKIADRKLRQTLAELGSIRREERAREREANAKRNAGDAKTDAIRDMYLESSKLYNQAAQLYRHLMYSSGNVAINTTVLKERASRTMRDARSASIFAEEASTCASI